MAGTQWTSKRRTLVISTFVLDCELRQMCRRSTMSAAWGRRGRLKAVNARYRRGPKVWLKSKNPASAGAAPGT